MKKLNLLKPKLKSIYLEEGKGQNLKYLYIPKKLDKEALRSDVKAGAVHFKECLEFAEKKPSRMVLIDCNNEEEGMMAATYLAGIYNKADKVYDQWYDSIEEDDIPWNAEEEAKVFEESDFEAELDDIYGDGNEEDVFECVEWDEHPQRIPVIEAGELMRYADDDSFTPFPNPTGFSLGCNNMHGKPPYWLTTREEPVCIVERGGGFGCSFLVQHLKRFDNNRHVFVVLVNKDDAHFEIMDDEEEYESTYMDPRDAKICEMVLEYTAGLVKVKSSEEEMKKYYQVLFENWAHEYDRKLEARFPKNVVVEQVLTMRGEAKSELMEKVYRYILSQENVGQTLTKDDFAVLKRFRVLGLGKEPKKEVKSVQKLHTHLVGMDDVKKQVQSIVDVMKYNKKRQQLGMSNGGYHNVHLLIGAPGTAKTTVAQMLGDIMCEQRLLPSNRFISINGADLKGMYVGHSAPKTKSYFDNYDIILIDEAYSVASERDMDSFSQEAIAHLIIELEKHGMDKLVMFAGYGGTKVNEKDNKMKVFLDANPGIRSRINSTIYFNSYTPDEMVEIVHCQARNQDYQLVKEADELIRSYFEERVKAPDFGNGREARSLLENIAREAAARIMKLPENKQTKKALQELTIVDVQAALAQQREAYVMQRGQLAKKCGFKN